jgi:carbonic anhydrase/acetyltransferase-like protein (isoleucine patch superfamily)
MKKPVIHENASVAPGAVVVGDAHLADGANVWYGAVIRADLEPVEIGERTNIQDNCVVHVSSGFPVKLGDDVTVGHGAIVHGCTVGSGTLVGMGSIIMDGAVVGSGCIVAAGALVVGGTVVPDGSLVMGSPAKVKRPTTEAEREANLRTAAKYAAEAQREL